MCIYDYLSLEGPNRTCTRVPEIPQHSVSHARQTLPSTDFPEGQAILTDRLGRIISFIGNVRNRSYTIITPAIPSAGLHKHRLLALPRARIHLAAVPASPILDIALVIALLVDAMVDSTHAVRTIRRALVDFDEWHVGVCGCEDGIPVLRRRCD
jgi:hypothetical protein